jgi:uncharacterized protein
MTIVKELSRFPVKSTQGQSVDELQLDPRGVIGDRRWGLRDLTTGNILTGRRVPELLHAIGGDGMVTLPSGVTTRDAGESSARLGRSVELVSAGCLGIGSLVVQPGIIRIGDTVETLR